MVGGLFLWPALRYGTGYQIVWEIRPSAETPSSVHWIRFYFQLTRVHSALELFGRCAVQIYLLTYLLISEVLRLNPGSSGKWRSDIFISPYPLREDLYKWSHMRMHAGASLNVPAPPPERQKFSLLNFMTIFFDFSRNRVTYPQWHDLFSCHLQLVRLYGPL